MFTRIDHVVIAVPSVPDAIAAYRRLGFNVYPGGDHTGLGTHCAIAFLGDQYLELTAIRDAAEYRAASAHRAVADAGLDDFIAVGGGIRAIVLACDDLDTEVAAMRGRGVEVSDPETLERVLPNGRRLRSRVAVPVGLPLQFVQHLDDLDARRAQVPEHAPHPNGVLEFDGLYVAGADLEDMVSRYRRALGNEEPRRLSGIIIVANIAMWDVGRSQIALAEPDGPGPAKSALEGRGEAPFQIIYRTTSISATSAYLAAHGITPVAGGRRSTGEMTVVVGVPDALGCNQGFVGPES